MSQDNTFDPYRIWLGIPPEEQPPHHYRLLGVRLFETNTEVIANAADSRMLHLKTFQSGQYSALSQQLLNSVSTAKLCLLDPGAKAEYDGRLQEAIRARSAQVERPLSPPLQAPPVQSPSQTAAWQPSVPQMPSPRPTPQQSPVQQPVPPRSLPQQTSAQQSPPQQTPPPQSPPVQPPTPSPGRSPEAPSSEELAKIGKRRVSPYAYRQRRTSPATAAIIVTIFVVALGFIILLMAL